MDVEEFPSLGRKAVQEGQGAFGADVSDLALQYSKFPDTTPDSLSGPLGHVVQVWLTLSAQERVNMAGQRPLCLKRFAHNVDPWLASGTSDFRKMPTIPSLRMGPCAQTVQTINRVYYKKLLSFQDSGLLVHTLADTPVTNLPVKTLDTESWWTFHTYGHNSMLGEIKHALCNPMREGTLESFYPTSSGLSLHVAFYLLILLCTILL